MSKVRLMTSLALQEIEIPTIHHGNGVFDKTDGLGADRQGFPARFVNGFWPENHLRDFPVGCLRQPAVQSTKHLDQAFAVTRCQLQWPRYWPRRLAVEVTAKAQCTRDPQQESSSSGITAAMGAPGLCSTSQM